MIEIDKTALPPTTAFAAFTPHHLQSMRDHVEIGTSLLVVGFPLGLAMALREHPRFALTLSSDYIELLFKSAPLHDIGKVGIHDDILLKAA